MRECPDPRPHHPCQRNRKDGKRLGIASGRRLKWFWGTILVLGVAMCPVAPVTLRPVPIRRASPGTRAASFVTCQLSAVSYQWRPASARSAASSAAPTDG
jgi:hypothetical protein